MHSYLPSKKFVQTFLILAAVFIIGYFLYHIVFKKDGKIPFISGNKDSSAKLETKEIVLQDLMEKDTDGDGIKDWEEALWGTDPEKSDTDGDGISDFDYIEKRREEVRQASGTPDQELSDTNATDVFTKEFFAAIVALQQSGQLNSQTLADLSKQLAGNIGQQKSLPDIYSITDIKIVSNPSRADMQIYGQAVQAMSSSYFAKGIGTELDVTSNALSTEDPAEYAKIASIANAYADFAGKLVALQTPEDISVDVLNLANNMQKSAKALQNISAIPTNELIGIIGISQYSTYSDDMVNSFTSLSNYLQNNGILQ